MDSCGPFPMRFLNGNSSHFHLILDDYSNFGSMALLLKKNAVAKHFKKVQAEWELRSGNKVKMVRCDGAKELVEGELKEHLEKKGIVLQTTAPYAYQQNGKAEHYI